jgi:phasin family protein
MIKSFEDVQDYGKQGFEAWVASATAMTKGFQAVAAETAEYSKKSFEKGTAAFQEIMAAKSLDRALAVQQGFAKDAYEGFVGQLNKFGELYAAAAKEAYKPFEAQIAQFTGKVGGPK